MFPFFDNNRSEIEEAARKQYLHLMKSPDAYEKKHLFQESKNLTYCSESYTIKQKNQIIPYVLRY
jgi:hypothetical protein